MNAAKSERRDKKKLFMNFEEKTLIMLNHEMIVKIFNIKAHRKCLEDNRSTWHILYALQNVKDINLDFLFKTKDKNIEYAPLES